MPERADKLTALAELDSFTEVLRYCSKCSSALPVRKEPSLSFRALHATIWQPHCS